MSDNKEMQLQEIAAQLRCPEGDEGIRMADMMHETNISMTRSALAALEPADGDAVLELGHGNGGHVPELLAPAPNIRYTGLDISPLMKAEAEKVNADLVAGGHVSFVLYDGKQVPFGNDSFDKILTVNTIYFWEDPVALLRELYRVMKNGGRCSIAFGQRSFMELLPFTPFGFTLYDTGKVKELVAQTLFRLAGVTDHTEQIGSKTGEFVERTYSVAVLEK